MQFCVRSFVFRGLASLFCNLVAPSHLMLRRREAASKDGHARAARAISRRGGTPSKQGFPSSVGHRQDADERDR